MISSKFKKSANSPIHSGSSKKARRRASPSPSKSLSSRPSFCPRTEANRNRRGRSPHQPCETLAAPEAIRLSRGSGKRSLKRAQDAPGSGLTPKTSTAPGLHLLSKSATLVWLKRPLAKKWLPRKEQEQAPPNSASQALLCSQSKGLLKADPKLQEAVEVSTAPAQTAARKQCKLNRRLLAGCSTEQKQPLVRTRFTRHPRRCASLLCRAVLGALGSKPKGQHLDLTQGLRKEEKLSAGGAKCQSRTARFRASAAKE